MREERRIETMTDNMTTHAAFDAPGTAVSNDTVYEYRPVDYTQEDISIIRELAGEVV